MNIILNCDKNLGIGKNNNLLFHLPKDMKFFKQKTLNKIVVMGHNTLLSLPNGKPLPNRTNIVLSSKISPSQAKSEGYISVKNLSELFETLKNYNSDDVFVIGGAKIYQTLLPYCSKIYLTKVDSDGNADKFFYNIDQLANWKMTYCSEPITDNGYIIRFTEYTNTDEVLKIPTYEE